MDDVPERIEHTVLGPTTGWPDVRETVEEARRYGTRACVPPFAVAAAAEHADVPLTTVIDFPHGQGQARAVSEAAKCAWDDGVDEIDLVLNVGRLKAGEDEAVGEKVAETVAAVPLPVKVIVEAPLLTDAEKRRAGELVADAGADYLKTATGFSEGGATVADVELLAEYLPVKASGGVGSWERAEAMFEAGAERIGASSGDVIVAEWREATGRDPVEDETADDAGGSNEGDDSAY